MADTPSQPPGWPFDEGLPEIPPPPASTPGPTYEPPAPTHQAPSAFEPPPPGATHQPPPPPGATHQPPPPPPASGPDYRSMTRMQPSPREQRKREKRKNRSPWRAVFIVLGVLALLVGGCGLWLLSVTKPAVDEANRFLAAVDQGDYQRAAEMASCGIISADELEEVFSFQDIDYNLKSVEVQNGNSASVSGTINVPGKNYRQVFFSLLKAGDNWRVCTIFVN